MQSRSMKTILWGLMLGVFAQGAAANLLINPTRVQFNPSDRTADITLINTSPSSNTYRIEWAEKKAKASGGYEDLSESAAANFPTASNMLRLSPKQVTLKPGERQTVKLAIRRPQSLANGEYRSHLLFKALPTAENAANPNSSTKVKVILSFAIPVVVRQGPEDAAMNVNDAAISYNPAKKDGSVTVKLSRTGITSGFGDLNAYWTPTGSTERLIAKIGDYSFWPELSTATVSLAWVGADFAQTDGKLRIVYEGVNNLRGKTFFDKTFSINRSMIKTLN